MNRAKTLTTALCGYLNILDSCRRGRKSEAIGTWCYFHQGLRYHCLCVYSDRSTIMQDYRYDHISEVIPGTPRYHFMPIIQVYIESPRMDIYLY